MKNYFVKIVIMTVMTFMLTVQPRAQSGEKLYVYAKDGTTYSFVLNDLQKITFSGENVNLYPVSGAVMALPIDAISVVTFKSKSTSLPVIKKASLKLFVDADKLSIESDMDITAVKLYNVQGKLLKSQSINSNSANISLSSYPAGAYIVQVFGGGVSVHKIIKK